MKLINISSYTLSNTQLPLFPPLYPLSISQACALSHWMNAIKLITTTAVSRFQKCVQNSEALVFKS